jgi:REP element-mobilizing transposase RayT
MRKIKFQNNEYYHIFNRGADKREVFMDESDYIRFLEDIKELNTNKAVGGLYRKFLREKAKRGSASKLEAEPLIEPLVEFICYCLNPNHFHFILKQLADNGIVKFMQRLGTAYTMYFNNKNKRSGVLFQGKFKAVKIESFEHLLWLSVYVNTNARIHGIINDAINYPWCSYPCYLGLKECNFCNKNIILQEVRDYKKIADEAALFMKEKKEIEKYLIE